MDDTSFSGLLLGTLAGDTIGLPYEGLSHDRVLKRKKPLRQAFLFGHGMCSDDTEHTMLVAQSLLLAPRDVNLFREQLAKRLRWWLLGFPAGVGSATLRSIVRLWFRVSPTHSEVYQRAA